MQVTLVVPISKTQARNRLEEAVEMAKSGADLPAEWVEYATEVGNSPRKVDTTVLGCALVAKSCDKRVNPLIVKQGINERGYNMRAIAEGALLPARHNHAIDIGSTSSANPVNSSTWLKPRTLEDVVTRNPASFARFLDILREVDKLDEEDALLALAAWARVRMAVTAAKRSIRVTSTGADLNLLLAACRTFVLENAEMGARGQALVAAAFGLVWGDVVTGKVTDPSRNWPGDVHAFPELGGVPLVAAEVKQRPVAGGEVRNFISECASAGVSNIFYVVLHDKLQDDMGDIEPVSIADSNGALFTWFQDVDSFMLAALSWSPKSTEDKIRDFIVDMSCRLEQVELSAETQARWAELTQSQTSG